MRANRPVHTALVAGALALLALGIASPAARSAGSDEVWASNALATRPMARVAMLPVVAIADDPAAERAVAQGWKDLCCGTAAVWIPCCDVVARLERAPAGGGELVRTIEGEIWRDGAASPRSAALAARLLGVDAVLSLRIERWELADGGRGTVALTATLTGADGRRLWSISGSAEHGRGLQSSEANFRFDDAAFWDPRLEAPREGRIGVALYALLARWSPELPTPLFDDRAATPLLAGRPANAVVAR